jgi:hypothetical protein
MRSITLLVLPLVAASAAHAQAPNVNWADWTSGTPGTAGVAAGSFDTVDGPVAIDYAGQIQFIQTGTGTNYFTEGNPKPYTGNPTVVANAPTAAEMIALSQAATRTLTFSQAVDNLFFAFVSLNGNGFRFDSDFEVVSTGQGFWGSGTVQKVDLGNGQFQLNGTSGEPHGVIRFTGSVSQITWASLNNENWYGFTVGTYGVAPPPPIPEPGTWALMALGLAGIGAAARRRRG